MNRKRFNREYDEINRTSRVKMHKSGKHWVRTVMSQLSLLKVSNGKGEQRFYLTNPTVKNKARLGGKAAILATSLLIGCSVSQQVLAEVQEQPILEQSEELISSVAVVETANPVPVEEITEEVIEVDESVQPAPSLEVAVTRMLFRSANIFWTIEYRDSSGKRIHRTPHAISITTGEEVGRHLVVLDLTQLPKGYVLAPGQEAHMEVEVLEGQKNVIVVQVEEDGFFEPEYVTEESQVAEESSLEETPSAEPVNTETPENLVEETKLAVEESGKTSSELEVDSSQPVEEAASPVEGENSLVEEKLEGTTGLRRFVTYTAPDETEKIRAVRWNYDPTTDTSTWKITVRYDTDDFVGVHFLSDARLISRITPPGWQWVNPRDYSVNLQQWGINFGFVQAWMRAPTNDNLIKTETFVFQYKGNKSPVVVRAVSAKVHNQFQQVMRQNSDSSLALKGRWEATPRMVMSAKNLATLRTEKDVHRYQPMGKTVRLLNGDNIDNNVDNFIDLSSVPAARISRVAWLNKPNTGIGGSQTGTVRVTYRDNTFDDVQVTADVVNLPLSTVVRVPVGTSEAELKRKVAEAVAVSGSSWTAGTVSSVPTTTGPAIYTSGSNGAKISLINREAAGGKAILNQSDLGNVSYALEGDHLVITRHQFDVRVEVVARDQDTYAPTGKTVRLLNGDNIDNNARDFVHLTDIPQDKIANVTWLTKPTTTTGGNQPGRVRVTYRDNSSDDVQVTADVVNLPTSSPVTVKQGMGTEELTNLVLAAVDTSGTSWTKGNVSHLPSTASVASYTDGSNGAKLTLTNSEAAAGKAVLSQSDLSGVSYQLENGQLIISRQNVDVPVTVIAQDKDIYQPVGKTIRLLASENIAGNVNDFVDVTAIPAAKRPSLSWKTQPNTGQTGQQSGLITARYKDGSTEDIQVVADVVALPPVGSVTVTRGTSAEDLRTQVAAAVNTDGTSWTKGTINQLPSTASVASFTSGNNGAKINLTNSETKGAKGLLSQSDLAGVSYRIDGDRLVITKENVDVAVNVVAPAPSFTAANSKPSDILVWKNTDMTLPKTIGIDPGRGVDGIYFIADGGDETRPLETGLTLTREGQVSGRTNLEPGNTTVRLILTSNGERVRSGDFWITVNDTEVSPIQKIQGQALTAEEILNAVQVTGPAANSYTNVANVTTKELVDPNNLPTSGSNNRVQVRLVNRDSQVKIVEVPVSFASAPSFTAQPENLVLWKNTDLTVPKTIGFQPGESGVDKIYIANRDTSKRPAAISGLEIDDRTGQYTGKPDASVGVGVLTRTVVLQKGADTASDKVQVQSNQYEIFVMDATAATVQKLEGEEVTIDDLRSAITIQNGVISSASENGRRLVEIPAENYAIKAGQTIPRTGTNVPVIVEITNQQGQKKEVQVLVTFSQHLSASVSPQTVPEKVAIDPTNAPKVVTPNKPDTTITGPIQPVNGLTVDEQGRLSGKPTIDDWTDEEERQVSIPVTLTKDRESVEISVPVTIQRDTDGDGTVDKSDDDDDNDGISDDDDKYPKIKRTDNPVVSAENGRVTEGQPLTPTIPVTVDTDDKTPTVTVDGLPRGLSYNPTSKQIAGQPAKEKWQGDAEHKDYPVIITATDEAGRQGQKVITITVLRDTDNDGVADIDDTDDDNDGVNDDVEKARGTDPKDPDTTAPSSPVIATPEDGSASLTPPTEEDTKIVEITYIPEGSENPVTLIIEKGPAGWTEQTPFPEGLVLTPDTGLVTIPEEKVKDGSPISAKAKDKAGNSSPEARDTVATPVALSGTTSPQTVPEKVAIDAINAPKVVTPNKPDTIITGPSQPVNGLTVDEQGRLSGTPTIDDWTDEEERQVTIPVTLTKDRESVEISVPVTIQRDTDGDGTVDKSDDDDDNDGITDGNDKYPKIKRTDNPVVSAENGRVTEGQPLTPAIPVSVDTDDKTPTVTVNGLPRGLTYNPTSKQIAGQPAKEKWQGDAEHKDYPVTITATDEAGRQGQTSITITVLRDTDNDGIADSDDPDDDNDGVNDDVEKARGTDPKDPDTTAPSSPVIATPEDGSASITPPTEEDTKIVEITYIPEGSENPITLIIEKGPAGWTEQTPFPEGLVLTPDTGLVTISEEKVKDGSPISAKAKDKAGNSSPEARDTVATPVALSGTTSPQTVPEKVAIDPTNAPKVVTPNKPDTTITGPSQPVKGLTVDEQGRLSGTPTIDDWGDEQEKRSVTIPVTLTKGREIVQVSVPVTIQRDTDGDGTVDKSDDDDDNDGITDGNDKYPKIKRTDNPVVSAENGRVTEGQQLTPAIPVTVDTDDKTPTVTIYGLPRGLTYNPTSKQIVGQPVKEKWQGDAEWKDYPVTITATDEAGRLGQTSITITVLRDTDNDGVADISDKDDDNDGVEDPYDSEPKKRNTHIHTYPAKVLENIPVPEDISVLTTDSPATITPGQAVNGLTVSETGGLTGIPTVTDWGGDDEERVVELPVTVTIGNRTDDLLIPVTIQRDTDGDGQADIVDDDDDNDGLPDEKEKLLGTDPKVSDTDGDGLTDGDEDEIGTNPKLIDTDGDGLGDLDEIIRDTHPKDPDTDDDGLTDGEEVELKTDPKDPDSDHDGLTDGDEKELKTNPNDSDSDDDGLKDGDEVLIGSNPNLSDTDGDGRNDGDEVTDGTVPTDPNSIASSIVPIEDVTGIVGQPLTAIPVTANQIPTDGGLTVTGLPDGVTYSPTTGTISGTPSRPGTYPVTIAVVGKNGQPVIGSDGNPVTEIFTITVKEEDKFTNGAGLTNGSSPAYDLSADDDGDGLTNGEELELGTNPNLSDTDGDGRNDGDEVTDGTLPTDPNSIASSIVPIEDVTGIVGQPLTAIPVTANQIPTDGSLTVTGLPDGVTYSPTTGTISGTPSRPGTYPVTIAVVGKNGQPVLGSDGNPVTETFTIIVKEEDKHANGAGLTNNLPQAYDLSADDDGDGLTNGEELELGSNPNLSDTDGDGRNDGDEVTDGTVPTDPNSIASSIVPIEDVTGIVGQPLTAIPVTANQIPTDGGLTVTGLPDGVTYSPTASTISGTPSRPGTYPVTLAVVGKNGQPVLGSDGNPVTETFTITVKEEDKFTNGAGLTNGSSPAYDLSADDDGDGLTNGEELEIGTNPNLSDTDGDGRNDGDEVSDGTLPTDPNSIASSIVPIEDVTGIVGQPLTAIPVTANQIPTDGGLTVTGLPDGVTYSPTAGTISGTPSRPGTYPVTIAVVGKNGQPVLGSDGNPVIETFTITVKEEDKHANGAGLTNGSLPAYDLSADDDGDGLTNGEELEIGTNPNLSDTDGDGRNDGDEVSDGTVPTDPNSIASSIVPIEDVTGIVGQPLTSIPVTANQIPTDGGLTVTGLPDGVTYSPTTGTISGTPSRPGTYPVTIAVVGKNGQPVIGSDGNPVTEIFTITVKEEDKFTNGAG
ncbi:TPA: putative Ig domain-containing protein, partial [Streptococcus suis]